MIKILTDTSCDLSLKQAEALDIEILPISVSFGEETFTPGEDLTNEEFYAKLAKAEELPKTAQITPIRLEEEFRRHLDNGDKVIGMFISKELSGTYGNAIMSKNLIGSDDIFIVDTNNTTFGLALLLIEACKMRDNGDSAEQIYNKITELSKRVVLYASIETLKYLKMGGRLSATTALVAGVLGICPIISVEGGKVISAGKARGRAASYKFIEDKISEIGISSDYGVTFGHSDRLDACKQGEKYFDKYIGKRHVTRCEIGSVVGTHVGPGAVGLAFIKK